MSAKNVTAVELTMRSTRRELESAHRKLSEIAAILNGIDVADMTDAEKKILSVVKGSR